MRTLSFFAACLAGLAAVTNAGDCVVCEKLIGQVEEQFKAAEKVAKAEKTKGWNAMEKIESLIDDMCEKATSQTDKKVCYYIVPIKRKVSLPMSSYAPPDRICKKLKKESPELCAVREAVKVEVGKTNYNELKIRDLKKILRDRGVQCVNCLEKSDFVKKCEDSEDLATHDEL